MSTVAFANQKGGVGKTTVVLGVAAAAARRGLDVAVIDIDPQGNASMGLGVGNSDVGVVDVLTESPRRLADVTRPSTWSTAWGRPPVVVASSPMLASLEPQLAADPVGAQDRLAAAVQEARHDVMLIDCPPALGLLSINALFAADAVAVVTEPGAWAVDGVARMHTTIERIQQRTGGRPRLAGVVANRVGRTRDSAYWHQQLSDAYPAHMLGPIHLRTALAEAAAASLPIQALGTRPGATEAFGEFDDLLDHFVRPAHAVPEEAAAHYVSPADGGTIRADV